MKDHTEVFTSIEKKENVNYPVLVPNMKGLEQALGLGVKEVAIFIAASNSFSRRNINCTIEESLQRYDEVIAHAIQSKVKVRGYISTVVGCPYEGPVAPDGNTLVIFILTHLLVVAKLSLHLFNKGCYEISLGDTIGVGTPSTMTKMLRAVQKVVPTSALAVHCHNTYGQALSNIYASLLVGVNNIDSSVAGLGGCPFAPGATGMYNICIVYCVGNVPTEDVVYMLNGLGVKTNLNLDMLIETGQYMCNFLGKRNASNVAVALLAKKQQQEQQQQQQASVQQQTSAKTSNNNNTICV